MDVSLKQEFLDLFSNVAPELEIEEISDRSFDAVVQFLVFASSIGLFTGLWKVLELWSQRHASATIKITYPASDGSTVEIEYHNKTSREVQKILADRPPKPDRPVKVLLPNKSS